MPTWGNAFSSVPPARAMASAAAFGTPSPVKTTRYRVGAAETAIGASSAATETRSPWIAFIAVLHPSGADLDSLPAPG